MTGSAIVTINTAAQAGARAAVGAPSAGEPSGIHLLAGAPMLIGAGILLLAVIDLIHFFWWGRRP